MKPHPAPRDQDNAVVAVDGKEVRLTNLRKIFWPEIGLTKGDLLQYYADVAPALLPHIHNRAMVMKRYPHGASGEFFFMKRAPSPRPAWIEICSIDHGSKGVIDFPMIQDRAALLWVINLGCIDLNQWYATCDDIDRPDYVHFDLDPGVGAAFDRVLETALVVREALDALEDAVGREDDRIERAPRLRADRARAGAGRRADVRARARAGAGAPASGADHRRVPRREAPARPRARGLQPEPLGQHAGVGLLGAAAPRRDRLHARDLEGNREGRAHRGLHDEERARPASPSSAIYGSRCSRRAAASTSRSTCNIDECSAESAAGNSSRARSPQPLSPAPAVSRRLRPAKRPNVLFILADDLGYGDLSCYGRPDYKTPVLDGLAKQGIRFTDNYAAAPVCTPTRCAYITGRYPQRLAGRSRRAAQGFVAGGCRACRRSIRRSRRC